MRHQLGRPWRQLDTESCCVGSALESNDSFTMALTGLGADASHFAFDTCGTSRGIELASAFSNVSFVDIRDVSHLVSRGLLGGVSIWLVAGGWSTVFRRVQVGVGG